MGRFQYDLTFKTPDEEQIEKRNLTMNELIDEVKELLLIHYKLDYCLQPLLLLVDCALKYF